MSNKAKVEELNNALVDDAYLKELVEQLQILFG